MLAALLFRSIGDADLKPALTSQPEVTQHELSAEDEFVVLASDGLWDKLSNEDAVGLVSDTVKQPTMAAQRSVLQCMLALQTPHQPRNHGAGMLCIQSRLSSVVCLAQVYITPPQVGSLVVALVTHLQAACSLTGHHIVGNVS